jgi:hypothetical protein
LPFGFLGDCSDDRILTSCSPYYVKQGCKGLLLFFCRIDDHELIICILLEESSHPWTRCHIKMTASALSVAALFSKYVWVGFSYIVWLGWHLPDITESLKQ